MKSKYFFTIRDFEIFLKVPEHCAGCASANEGPALEYWYVFTKNLPLFHHLRNQMPLMLEMRQNRWSPY